MYYSGTGEPRVGFKPWVQSKMFIHMATPAYSDGRDRVSAGGRYRASVWVRPGGRYSRPPQSSRCSAACRGYSRSLARRLQQPVYGALRSKRRVLARLCHRARGRYCCYRRVLRPRHNRHYKRYCRSSRRYPSYSQGGSPQYLRWFTRRNKSNFSMSPERVINMSTLFPWSLRFPRASMRRAEWAPPTARLDASAHATTPRPQTGSRWR